MTTVQTLGIDGSDGSAGTIGQPIGGTGQDGSAAASTLDFAAAYGAFDPVFHQYAFYHHVRGGNGGRGGAGYTDFSGSNDGAGGASGSGGSAYSHLTNLHFSGALPGSASGQVYVQSRADGGSAQGSGYNGTPGPESSLTTGSGGNGASATALLDTLTFQLSNPSVALNLQVTANGGAGGNTTTNYGFGGDGGAGGSATAELSGASVTGGGSVVWLFAAASAGRGGNSGFPAYNNGRGDGGDGADAFAAIRNNVIVLDAASRVDVSLFSSAGTGGIGGPGFFNGANGLASAAFTGNEIRLGNSTSGLSQLRIFTPDPLSLSQFDYFGNIFDGGAGLDYLQLNVNSVIAVTFSMLVNTVTGFERIQSGDGNDSLTGDNQANYFESSGGNDTILGGGGDDTLNGGAGNDTLNGGGGIDTATYADATGGVSVSLSILIPQLVGGGADTDRLLQIENLTGSSYGDALLGSTLANVLDGRSGNDNLRGYAGNDMLIGGLGDDTLFGGGDNDTLTGDDGNDILRGDAGDDAMTGGIGNDTYFVDSLADTVTELAGEGDDIVFARISYTLGDNLERLTFDNGAGLTGTGNALDNRLSGNDAASYLYGMDGADTLFGNGGRDILEGGNGNDTLTGGIAKDELNGGAGADTFRFASLVEMLATAGTADVIHDFSQTELDRIQLNLVDADTNTAGVDEAFTFIGTATFSNVAGQLRYQQISGNTYVSGDVNGDAVADFFIRIDGAVTLVAGDFVL